MGAAENNKIYMTADDETEETLQLVAMLEGLSINHLCEAIDNQRNAACGFARAARIFAAHYLMAFIDQEDHQALHDTPESVLQRAIMAVANDKSDADLTAISPE